MTKTLASDLKFLPTKIYADYFITDQNFQILRLPFFIFNEWQKFLPIFITADFFVPTNIFADYNSCQPSFYR